MIESSVHMMQKICLRPAHMGPCVELWPAVDWLGNHKARGQHWVHDRNPWHMQIWCWLACMCSVCYICRTLLCAQSFCHFSFSVTIGCISEHTEEENLPSGIYGDYGPEWKVSTCISLLVLKSTITWTLEVLTRFAKIGPLTIKPL